MECVFAMVTGRYREVFEEAWEDLEDSYLPRRSPGEFTVRQEAWCDDILEGAASQGLRRFSGILKTSDHDKLVEQLEQCLTTTGWFQLGMCLYWVFQEARRARFPMEGDLLERSRAKLPFDGDTVDGPPLAWVTVWVGRYSNSYGDTIPESLKEWGHVFWDSERLVRSKGVEEVMRERERYHMPA